MGLAEWFSGFCDNLQVRDGGTISTRYKAITQRLNTDFWSTTSDTAHSLYVGSYGRNTAVSGFSDLDMIFQLPYSTYEQYDAHQGNGQSALLQAVKAAIERTYSRTSLRADGQVILVPFNDGVNRGRFICATWRKTSSARRGAASAGILSTAYCLPKV